MKRPLIALLLFTAAFTACQTPSEIYYTDRYPIARIEAAVEVSATTPPTPPTPPAPQATEEPTPTPTPEDPIIKTITDDVIATAPVKAGGSYTLNFSRYNGGRVEVTPAAEIAPLPGVFFKTPGQTDLLFLFAEQEYTCVVSSYKSEQNTSLALFTVDLTAHYKLLYPDAKITKVLRKEYTSHP